MFKKGDKVSVLNENLKGEIISISGMRATILAEDGFDYDFLQSELTLIPNKDEIAASLKNLNSIITEKEKSHSPPKTSVKNLLPGEKIIDLHIHELVEKTAHLSNFDMLTIQMNTVKNALLNTDKNKYRKIIFIHGIGIGKLKQELELYLSKNKYVHYPAPFNKFGQGAITVEL
jgi:dsDNA-specific endonuclease/ATPase MutS2